MRPNPVTAGAAAIALAIAFNIPFALLARLFDYPAILHRPAGDVLMAFHAAGPALILVWYAFTLTALALVPIAILVAAAPRDDATRSWPAVGAAICGALAGTAQAIGLSRWVFVVPALARQHADPTVIEAARAQAAHTFEMLNLWGGVAVGEHIGQFLTCAWVAFMLAATVRSTRPIDRVARVLGGAAILAIGFGLGDGLSVALGTPTHLFRLATVTGYLALTGWLIATGIGLMTSGGRGNPSPKTPGEPAQS